MSENGLYSSDSFRPGHFQNLIDEVKAKLSFTYFKKRASNGQRD